MLRALWLAALVVGVACTTEDPNGAAARDDVGPQHAIGVTSHLGIRMTSSIRACRDACWRDIPFDECARQRDACLGDASVRETPSALAASRCRQVSHTCRRLRRDCLQGCWTNPTPTIQDPARL